MEILMPLITLTPQESTILRMRFGIELDREYTHEEIGRQLSMTREMVVQAEKTALRKLRNPVSIRKLHESAMRPPFS